jgi:hypothetical protein
LIDSMLRYYVDFIKCTQTSQPRRGNVRVFTSGSIVEDRQRVYTGLVHLKNRNLPDFENKASLARKLQGSSDSFQ